MLLKSILLFFAKLPELCKTPLKMVKTVVRLDNKNSTFAERGRENKVLGRRDEQSSGTIAKRERIVYKVCVKMM